MIPNPNEVSAFAVYSGLAVTTKSRQRRNRKKRLLEKQVEIKSSKPVKDLNKVKKIKKLADIVKKSRGDKKVDASLKEECIDEVEVDCINDDNKPIVVVECSEPKSNVVVNGSKPSLSKPKRGKAGNMKKSEGKQKVVNSPKEECIDEVEADHSDDINSVVVDCSDPKSNGTVNGSKSIKLKPKQAKKNIQPLDPEKYSDSSSDDVFENKASKKLDREMRKRKHDERVAAQRALVVEKRSRMLEEAKQKIKGKPATSSIVEGKAAFQSLIAPFKADEFFTQYWEKKMLHIGRGGNGDNYSQIISTKEIDEMLRSNPLMFGVNVDVTSYSDGVRQTHNPEGRAHPHVLWDYYSNGCSVRFLNPQTYLVKVQALLSSLQEYFGCFVGCNVYLTPAGTQGFAPHYDDIEAFVLQVEGSKRWRVYPPRNGKEELARFSSGNFSQDEIGSPLLDKVLVPGDLLYFPRGFVHQAEALPGQHSLHITVSTYQKTSYLDLLQIAVPRALAKAGEEDVELRRGLPLGYLRGAGAGFPSGTLRSALASRLRKLLSSLDKYLDLDHAVDSMGVSFVHQSLPPVLTQDEANCSVYNGGLRMSEGTLTNRVDITLKTKVRWIRANAIRLVEEGGEEGEVRLYHSVDNSKVYEGHDVEFVVLDKGLAPALVHLIKAYPSYTPVQRLPCPTDDEKLVLAGDLWDRGLLISESPLKSSNESNETDV